MGLDAIRAFDPNEPYSVVWRRLPHWAQAGTVCFITWRTADSLPREVVERWIAERDALLLKEGICVDESGFVMHADVGGAAECGWISPKSANRGSFGRRQEKPDFGEIRLHWKALVDRLSPPVRWKLQCDLTDRFEEHLDECHGACLLRRRDLANIVGESLRKFDGQRYELTDFVVMPNHVHILAAFHDEQGMLAQCASWKRYTARRINQATAQQGSFWQEDAFDHLVRSPDQFDHYRRYIAANGPKAGLPDTGYLLYSKPL